MSIRMPSPPVFCATRLLSTTIGPGMFVSRATKLMPEPLLSEF